MAYVPVRPNDIGIEDGDDAFPGYRLKQARMLVAYVINDGITHLRVPCAWLLLECLELLVHGQYSVSFSFQRQVLVIPPGSVLAPQDGRAPICTPYEQTARARKPTSHGPQRAQACANPHG